MKIAFGAAVLATTLTAGALVSAQRSAPATMEVYKSPTCGCCSKWVEHVKQAGFSAKVTELDDQALDALNVGIQRRRVNWILDADIRGFFDNLSHEWMLKFIQHRVADRRILRLIQKWLKAGVSEDGDWLESRKGTPQGAVVSPLLANVYLHYVFDLWMEAWRKKQAQGDVIVVRYADDLVVGFEHRADAERFLEEFRERLAKFGGGGTDCSIPLRTANTKFSKQAFAGCVLVSDNESWIVTGRYGSTGVMTEWQTFVKNQKSLGITDPRLVCIDIQPYGSTQAPERNDILNIGGFSDAVFNVVASYLSGDSARFVAEVESIEL